MKSENKSVQRAWAFYDWANSAYSLVISTAVFPIYYEEVTSDVQGNLFELGSFGFSNVATYNLVIGLSFLSIAVLSPYLSALADISGKKKIFMRRFILLGSFACISMYFFDGHSILWGLAGAFFASIGFSGSLVFYNAYLPEIAKVEDHDRLSAKGYMLGYIGSSLLLIVILVLIQNPSWLGMSTGAVTRWSFVIVGFWWLLWSLYPLRVLPKNVYKRHIEKGWVTKAYNELISVFKIFRGMPRLGRFVLSFFFFSCGVQTTVFMATIFGKKELNMDSSQLIPTVLIIQFVAIGGAWMFAKLSEKVGNIKAIATSIVVWIGICVGAYFITEASQFMILGGFVGLVLGGIQSLARSTYSKMLPDTQDHATFFSFYDVAEKLSTTVGMITIALVEVYTSDLRNMTLALTTFFVISLLVLFTIPKSKYVY